MEGIPSIAYMSNNPYQHQQTPLPPSASPMLATAVNGAALMDLSSPPQASMTTLMMPNLESLEASTTGGVFEDEDVTMGVAGPLLHHEAREGELDEHNVIVVNTKHQLQQHNQPHHQQPFYAPSPSDGSVSDLDSVGMPSRPFASLSLSLGSLSGTHPQLLTSNSATSSTTFGTEEDMSSLALPVISAANTQEVDTRSAAHLLSQYRHEPQRQQQQQQQQQQQPHLLRPHSMPVRSRRLSEPNLGRPMHRELSEPSSAASSSTSIGHLRPSPGMSTGNVPVSMLPDDDDPMGETDVGLEMEGLPSVPPLERTFEWARSLAMAGTSFSLSSTSFTHPQSGAMTPEMSADDITSPAVAVRGSPNDHASGFTTSSSPPASDMSILSPIPEPAFVEQHVPEQHQLRESDSEARVRDAMLALQHLDAQQQIVLQRRTQLQQQHEQLQEIQKQLHEQLLFVTVQQQKTQRSQALHEQQRPESLPSQPDASPRNEQERAYLAQDKDLREQIAQLEHHRHQICTQQQQVKQAHEAMKREALHQRKQQMDIEFNKQMQQQIIQQHNHNQQHRQQQLETQRMQQQLQQRQRELQQHMQRMKHEHEMKKEPRASPSPSPPNGRHQHQQQSQPHRIVIPPLDVGASAGARDGHAVTTPITLSQQQPPHMRRDFSQHHPGQHFRIPKPPSTSRLAAAAAAAQGHAVATEPQHSHVHLAHAHAPYNSSPLQRSANPHHRAHSLPSTPIANLTRLMSSPSHGSRGHNPLHNVSLTPTSASHSLTAHSPILHARSPSLRSSISGNSSTGSATSDIPASPKRKTAGTSLSARKASKNKKTRKSSTGSSSSRTPRGKKKKPSTDDDEDGDVDMTKGSKSKSKSKGKSKTAPTKSSSRSSRSKKLTGEEKIRRVDGTLYRTGICIGLPINHEMINPELVTASAENRVYSCYVDFFDAEVEVFVADDDPQQRPLFKASDVAAALKRPKNMLSMYLSRNKRKVDSGIYQAASFLHKTRPRIDLKCGCYFLSTEAANRFKEYLKTRSQTRPE